MTMPFFHYNPDQEAPFTLFIEHRDKTQDGHWRPAAFAMLTKSLRTSGFLFALPPEDLKSFLLLLTFLTPNGDCAPTLPQLAEAFRLSQGKARARMERLLAARWHDQPIVLPHRFGTVEAFAPSPGLLPVREEEPKADEAPSLKSVPREIIIERSRRLYARPRAEVERQIAEMNEWKLPDDDATASGEAPPSDPNAELRSELLRAGLLPNQANELIARFDEVRIRRQLMWLPYRNVRKRAGFLIAAVKDDYEAPAGFGRVVAPRSDPAHPVAPEDEA